MGQVVVTVCNRNYQVNCDDGQEAHLLRLSRYLDKRAGELSAAIGHVSEPLLLVMIGLMLSDELSDAYGEIDKNRVLALGVDPGVTDAVLASRINAVAARIETRIEALVKSTE